MTPGVLEETRERCRMVADRAAQVHVEVGRIASYADAIPAAFLCRPQMDAETHFLGRGNDTVAFFLTLDAINFGSGYFPLLRKRPGRSGYYSIAAALNDFFHRHGPLSPSDLAEIDGARCARIFAQRLGDPAAAELMALFARALNELGRTLLQRYGGSFIRLVAAAEGSAERLVGLLAEMPLFDDRADYRGMRVPFLKRAQLAAIDLFIALGGEGLGRFSDIERLTVCADNLVPHVLRLDGLLRYENSLAERIARGDWIPAGSPEEVEIRACAVHAGELLVKALRPRLRGGNAMLLDNYLWHRGHRPEYRKEPRHRTRTVFY